MYLDFKEIYNFKDDIHKSRPVWINWREQINYAEYQLDIQQPSDFLNYQSLSTSFVGFFKKPSLKINSKHVTWKSILINLIKYAIFQELIKGTFTLHYTESMIIRLSKLRTYKHRFYLRPLSQASSTSGWFNEHIIKGVHITKLETDLTSQIGSIMDQIFGFYDTYQEPSQVILNKHIKDRLSLLPDMELVRDKKYFGMVMHTIFNIDPISHKEYKKEIDAFTLSYNTLKRKSKIFTIFDLELRQGIRRQIQKRKDH